MNPRVIAAAIAAWLVMSIPAAQALQVNIYLGGSRVDSATLPRIVDGLDLGDIRPDAQHQNILLNLKNTSQLGSKHQLDSLYLYRCRGLGFQACAGSVQPETHPFTDNELELSLPWTSMRDKDFGYPQTANMIIGIRTNSPGGGSLLLSWHTVKRESSTTFIHYTSQAPSVDVSVSSIDNANAVKDYVKDEYMLPASNLQSANFQGASSLNVLASDAPPTFSASLIQGSAITSVSREFTSVLPEAPGLTGGVTLHQNPSYMCGNGIIEPGETESNCCYDVPCSGARYCDFDFCRAEPNLEVIPPTSTTVSNCNQQHTITITLRMNNQPSSLSLDSQSYVLDGGQSRSLVCTASGDTYTCPVTVPPDPNCDAGTFVYSDNSITFDVRYLDGPSQASEPLRVGFDDITVGSWTCGDGIYEPELGESSSNCCYDAGCSTGSYCDIASGAGPDTGECRSKPSGSSVLFRNITPASFPVYSPSGNALTFEYEILSPPDSLSLGTESCSPACISGYETCTASCSLSCSQDSSGGDCSATLTIQNYDNLKSYSVEPLIRVPVTYNDGPSLESDTLEASLPSYSFGAYYCGDFNCDSPEENYQNCCYDCGCPDGEFCSTENINDPSPEDACYDKDALKLVVDDTSTRTFTDQAVTHTLNVSARIEGIPPHGITLQGSPYSCELWDGTVPCEVRCTPEPQQGSEMELSCQVEIPSISAANTTSLTLIDNSITVRAEYNDGPKLAAKDLAAAVANVTINHVSHCGLDGCEYWLGETAENCCIDCGCSGLYGPSSVCVPGGADPESFCVDNSTIQTFVTDLEPGVGCEIMPPDAGGDCVFVEPNIFTINITNAPYGTKVSEALLEYDGEEVSIGSQCTQLSHDSVQCAILFDRIEGQSRFGGGGLVPKEEQKTARFTLTASYYQNNYRVTTHLEAEKDLTLTLNKSGALVSCEKKRNDLDDRISKFEDQKKAAWTVFLVLAGMTVAVCACCAIPGCDTMFGSWPCPLCSWGILVTSCVSMFLFPILGNTVAKIEELKGRRDTICAASTTSELADSIGSMNQIYYTLAGAAASVGCFLTVGAAIGGGSFANSLQIPSAGQSVPSGLEAAEPGDILTSANMP